MPLLLLPCNRARADGRMCSSHRLLHPAGVPFCASMCLFAFVMYELGCMVGSAIKESRLHDSTNANAQRSLVFIYICTLIIWSLFPVAWVATYCNPSRLFFNEVLVMFANFGAKVRRGWVWEPMSRAACLVPGATPVGLYAHAPRGRQAAHAGPHPPCT